MSIGITISLLVMLGFAVSALVAVAVGTVIHAGHEAARRDRHEAMLLRLVTARVATEGLSPGSELKAARLLERDARASATHTDFDPDAELAVELDRDRHRAARLVAQSTDPGTGEPMTPTGMA